MDKITRDNISISELSLWDENARFLDTHINKTEKELIQYLVRTKNVKLAEMADAIVEDFEFPQSERLIVWESGGKKIVLEGNRRLAAYKLLNNPELTDDVGLKKKLNTLRAGININSNFKLECLVTQDIELGFRYIDRKHLKANNEVPWGDNERAHHKSRRGSAGRREKLKVAITKRIGDLDIPEEWKETVLGRGFVTTFWRLIESEIFQDLFGLELEGDELKVGHGEFDEKLKVVIYDVIDKKKPSGKLFSRLNVNEIKNYVEQISESDYERVAGEIKTQTVDSPNSPTQTRKSTPKSLTRKNLIPKTCVLQIKKARRINDIYCELKDDLKIDNSNSAVPNAVGVLFRVFLEVSLDHYAEMNGYRFKKDDTIRQKITWVVKSLEDKGYDPKKFHNINKVGSSQGPQSYMSIENFHEYVHSPTTEPTSSELKGQWNNLQEFFEILWGDLNKDGKA